jgi:CheY-like chemotaxis protein
VPKFLVIDDHDDHRFLLVKTLLRKFPHAAVQECQNGETALELARTEAYAAIVDLVRRLRELEPNVPIVMVSGIDRTSAALAAGATRFLHYDEWLRIGTVVTELLKVGAPGQNKP